MFYVKNLPGWECWLRVGGGTAATLYALFSVGGILGWILAAGGAGIALSGVFGFCPMCTMVCRGAPHFPAWQIYRLAARLGAADKHPARLSRRATARVHSWLSAGIQISKNIDLTKKIMAKQEFSSYWKHQFTDAPDIDFHCVADDETHIVEIEPTPNQLDSKLLIELALRKFPEHGIDAIAVRNEGFGNARPAWKIIMILGGVRYKVEIVEMTTLGQHKEFTVLLKP